MAFPSQAPQLAELNSDRRNPMRKRIVPTTPPRTTETDISWLPLEQIASVEVTSEEEAYPVEGALLRSSGWRAMLPGEQTIRLLFDHPQALRQVHLVFQEHKVERTQEFVLCWSPDQGKTFHEIVRQQWHFSPQGATREVEDYHVDLAGVTQLELKIVPDQSGSNAHASLEQMRLA
jgi:hypothetical protein